MKNCPVLRGTALKTYNSTITAFIPGVGVDYALTENWTLLGGVHKGFAPPEPATSTLAAQNAKEEESINYEAGVRFNRKSLTADAIGFFTDYSNILGTDTFSSGGTSSGDQFNGGKVEVFGIETGVGYDLAELTSQSTYRFPTRLSYTYTQAEFQSSFNSSFEEWGNVRSGDELPYIPKHQFYASAGVETDKWLVAVSGKFNDRMRTVAGSGSLQEEFSTDRNFVVDLNGEYEVYKNTRAYVAVNNLFNEEYIAARRPAGSRPGAPQMIFGGLKVKF